ncbi:MAG TPA: LppX_LprAFG lipoprotein [Ktedonobacteraceae bacterium]
MFLFLRSERWKAGQWRGALAALGVGMACALLLAGCSLPWQHGTGTSGPGPKPSAQQVLTTLQKNFRSVSSFHITMKTDNLGNTSSSQVVIRQADGDVSMPDKVRAQASVLLSGQAMTVNLISVGAHQYITDPITGQWRVVTGMLDPRALTNPDTGIIALVGKLQNVTGPIDDNVNGTACWRVNGLLPAKDLAFFTGGGAPDGTMLKTSICAGKDDGLAYEITVVGQAASGDTPQTTRTFFLSKYNENISIVAPQVQ